MSRFVFSHGPRSMRQSLPLLATALACTSSMGCAAANTPVNATPNVPFVDAAADPTDELVDSGLDAQLDAGEHAEPQAHTDAGSGSGDGAGCMLGEAGSFATDQNLDLFGEVVYFAKGQELPAGRYRVSYADGCMKYNFLQPWRINQDVGAGEDGWWLVGASTSERVSLLPGTGGNALTGGYSTFDACVAANKELPPKEFEFTGGKLGIWLNDNPYLDNLSGEGGRNPKWQLTLLVEECPPDLEIF